MKQSNTKTNTVATIDTSALVMQDFTRAVFAVSILANLALMVTWLAVTV